MAGSDPFPRPRDGVEQGVVPGAAHPAGVAERVFREDGTRILAALIGSCDGDFELAQDALQDSFERALRAWPEDGLPRRPAGWILQVARRCAIDRLRRARTVREQAGRLARIAQLEAEEARGAADPDSIMAKADPMEDDRLRLIFTCCHPALAEEARVALTLRTVGGLTTREIARAFLVPESTMAQRLTRAQRKIREARIPYAVPQMAELPDRLGGVLRVLYLIFNEGYSASAGSRLVRADLCQEAIRTTRLLGRLMVDEPEIQGLLALMTLHHARAPGRTGPDGALMPLEQQDRALWDRAGIERGVGILDAAMVRRRPGPYQIQAAIAALHAQAPDAESTDWAQISALYEALARHHPSPIVDLNRAVALAMTRGPEFGLRLVDAMAAGGQLEHYHLLHAARADLLRRVGRTAEAADAYLRAIELGPNESERRYLLRRLEEVRGGG